MLALALALARHRFPNILPSLPNRANPSSPSGDSKAEMVRPWGIWSPVHLPYPSVEAWTDFDVDATKPIPFRPFRWGPHYPINMGIRPMPWESWIQLDSECVLWCW